MFIKKQHDEFLVGQVYMDDIVFGGYPDSLIFTFIDHMKIEFEMSMVGNYHSF